MANRSHSYPNWQVLLILLVLGGIIGGWIGDALLSVWPGLKTLGQVQSVGLPSFSLNLRVFTLNFGFMLHVNFFTLLGFVLAYIVYRRW
ncbi:MAG: DUF4321 domain-containing protein [Syntrophomonas sp.]